MISINSWPWGNFISYGIHLDGCHECLVSFTVIILRLTTRAIVGINYLVRVNGLARTKEHGAIEGHNVKVFHLLITKSTLIWT
jgi:hypothetical protein